VPLLTEHAWVPARGEGQRAERWILRISLGLTLGKLGGKCSETLRRYYLREESVDAIAAHLETTPAYVWQLLSSCRKRARQIYSNITTP